MNKVFGIGLNKTGTRSLAAAMRILGYRTLHKGDSATSGLVERAHAEGTGLLTHVGERYDAYFDVEAIVSRFRELDEQYPGSKFILTTRSLDEWLESRERHVRANQARAVRGEYTGCWLRVDRDAWRAERVSHHAAVTTYFSSRPDDLLVIDVSGGDGWDVLAPFLARPIPPQEFPWENRSGAGTYRRRRASVRGRSQALRLRVANVGRWMTQR